MHPPRKVLPYTLIGIGALLCFFGFHVYGHTSIENLSYTTIYNEQCETPENRELCIKEDYATLIFTNGEQKQVTRTVAEALHAHLTQLAHTRGIAIVVFGGSVLLCGILLLKPNLSS